MAWTAYFCFSTEDKSLIEIGNNLEKLDKLIESKKGFLKNDMVKNNEKLMSIVNQETKSEVEALNLQLLNIINKETKMEVENLKLQLIEQIKSISWD